MRYAILSDIHGNFPAFKAVLNDIRKSNVQQIISLGDLVGYGAEPGKCIDLARKLKVIHILGNHDAGVIGATDLKLWRGEALYTWADAAKRLSNSQLKWLIDLPYFYSGNDFLCVHGSPREPILEYIVDLKTALENECEARIVFFGHTHVPAFHDLDSATWFSPAPHKTEWLSLKGKYFINPGSVGQPRNGSTKAHYAIYDDKAQIVNFKSVVYNIWEAQDAIIQAGYAPMLAHRLSQGY